MAQPPINGNIFWGIEPKENMMSWLCYITVALIATLSLQSIFNFMVLITTIFN